MRLLVAFQSEQFGADKRSVLRFRLVEQFLHHLITHRLALAVCAVSLSTMQTGEDNDARNGTAHHAHTPYSTAEARCNALSHAVVEVVQVGEGSHNRLTAAVALHEVVYRTLHTCLKFGRKW